MLHTRIPPDNTARRPPEVRVCHGALASTIYNLSGDGIWVGYFPDGLESAPCADAGRLLYRDAFGMRTFGPSEVDTIAVPGLGTVVTVVLDRGPDVSETFSLILPSVEPPQAIGVPAPLRAFAVTTVHHAGVAAVGEPQHEVNAVMRLTGQALSAAANGA